MAKPKHKGRKYISHSETFRHRGTEYQINNNKSYGIHTKTLHSIIDQLDVCRSKWKRVFMLRFDLHQKFQSENSNTISKFSKNLAQRLDRAYGMKERSYIWAREHEKAKHQHYHFAISLDGDRIRHSNEINRIIKQTWESLECGNTVYHPNNCFQNIDDKPMREAVYRLSYLAKSRGKGYWPAQAKDFGTSRLRTSCKRLSEHSFEPSLAFKISRPTNQSTGN